MKRNDLLAVLSLISLLLVSIHLPDDYVHGFDKHVVNNPYAILIFVVWACGLLLFRERLIGRIILLLGGIVALAMPIIHLNGHFSPDFATSDGAFRFVWTLYALGTQTRPAPDALVAALGQPTLLGTGTYQWS
jgi:hypothetical protein